jgi:antitoxin (DNA-binding transcriptional repressor) of toxin-antitoxin stability system
VTVTKHGRPVVVVLAADGHERLKALVAPGAASTEESAGKNTSQ